MEIAPISSGMVIAPIAKKYKSTEQCEAGKCSKTDYGKRNELEMASVNTFAIASSRSISCGGDGHYTRDCYTR